MYISLGHSDSFTGNQFPQLQYVLKGIHRQEGPSLSRVRLHNRESPSYIRVYVNTSKTDLLGKEVTLFVGPYHPICPVATILSFLARCPDHHGPLFIHEDGSSLTKHQLVKQVRLALSQKGIEVSGYSGHSFQIGAATNPATVGIPEATIKMLGRWESSAYLQYSRTPREQLIPTSASLLTGANR